MFDDIPMIIFTWSTAEGRDKLCIIEHEIAMGTGTVGGQVRYVASRGFNAVRVEFGVYAGFDRLPHYRHCTPDAVFIDMEDM